MPTNRRRQSASHPDPRLLAERPLPQDGAPRIEQTRPGVPVRRGRLARSVTVNLAESPLSWLCARGHVSARQYDAGEALRRDYELSQLPPRVTMQWDAPPACETARGAPEGLSAGEAQIAAKQRFTAAVAALGPGLEDIAWRVLCAGEGLKTAESGLGWPARSGKLVLGLALNRLADHYRLPG
ncbi:DUF6456 domain-containing protein [Parasphingopyxis lamellibrachiae]|uniref:DUF6456 domain-containing protein n=1 Tax=Parasphingopyxis lamellibrachiae TaxID=680125 RepID=A0A3D9FE87_9SPHN|nr:DUF6456 domain-containing protein [Parasphingopyxis lamellibrachiae]RED16063.1 hypothetical protein DFR46_1074 [Parasphingopyxis lamellibrachiae]